jgi:hypothetical protein
MEGAELRLLLALLASRRLQFPSRLVECECQEEQLLVPLDL